MTVAGAGFLIAAGAVLGAGFVFGITRNGFSSVIRTSQSLSPAEIDVLRGKARRHNFAAGVAKDRLQMVDRPDWVRRQERIWTVIMRTAFGTSAVLALVGVLLLVA